jgi:hypothetical protein
MSEDEEQKELILATVQRLLDTAAKRDLQTMRERPAWRSASTVRWSALTTTSPWSGRTTTSWSTGARPEGWEV